MVKLILRINPLVNLFYHLERGGLSKRWKYAPVKEYRQKALKITDKTLLDSFSFLLDQENINSLIVRAIGGSGSIGEARGKLVEAMTAHADELAQVMGKSWSDYLQYFQDNVKPDLEKFKKKHQQLIPGIEGILFKLENLLNLDWREKYTIHVVEPTSMDFKPCGDAIYAEGVVVEAHRTLEPEEMIGLIIHELSHLEFDLMVLSLVPEELRTDLEYIREAIVFLIDNTWQKYVKEPPKPEKYKDERSRKTAFYATTFWNKWQCRIDSEEKQETFEDFLKGLLKDNHS